MDNENNDLVKQTSKIALNAALSPIKKSILLSLLSILPYLIGAFLIIILFCGIYMSIDEQIDQVANGAGDFGNKVGNAVQLYGFKTETEVEQNEEHRFYNTLNIYKSFYELTDYDTVLIANTLLFEGMYDDKLEFTELTDQNETEFPNLSEDDDSLPKKFLNIVDYIYKSFFNGFSSSYMGSSQYKKANKSLSEPVITLYKCHKLTGFIGITNEDVKQCYRGYLVAEYDYEIDKAIEDGTLEPEVKKGYLIFDDFITLSGLNTDLTNTNAGFNQFFKNIFDKLSDFFGNSIDYALFRINPVSWIIGKFYMSQLKKFENFIDRVETAISILIYGKLAEEPNNKPIWNNKHFFYNGYIVRFLKEYYKVSKGSERNIYLERENKLKIANLIIETTDAYMDMDENTKNNNPSKGDSGYATGSSCKPISSKDLESFSSPTNGVSCSVNSCFGVYAGKWACTAHKGVDVNASSGIYSVCDGVVTFAGMYNNGSASAIETDCNINGKVYHVRYLHMPLDDVYRFKVGDAISSGQRLGNQGAVGNGVTGAHLHLDVSLNGVYVNPESIVSGCSFSYDCEGTRNSCQSTGQYFCK